MDAARLGDIVGSLLLRKVGNVAGHGGSNNKTSGATLLEVVAHSLGTVEATRQIGLDHLVPVFDRAIKDAAASGAAGVGDESVNLAT